MRRSADRRPGPPRRTRRPARGDREHAEPALGELGSPCADDVRAYRRLARRSRRASQRLRRPLPHDQEPRAVRACTVVIRCVALSNGTSSTRGYAPRATRGRARPCRPPPAARPRSDRRGRTTDRPRAAGGDQAGVVAQRTRPRAARRGRGRRCGSRWPVALAAPRPAARSPPRSRLTDRRGRPGLLHDHAPGVSVPVLSVARTVTEPSVSTAGSRRTIALRAAIRRAPSARLSVTTAGRDSGTAATARLIAVTTISSIGSPRARPSTSTSPLSATTTAASTRPRSASRRWSGVACGRVSDQRRDPPERAGRHRCRVTSTTALPLTTTVPAATSLARPPRHAARACRRGPTRPVSADSSTSSADASSTSASAGTTSPFAQDARCRPAPARSAGTCVSTPSRRTRTAGARQLRAAPSPRGRPGAPAPPRPSSSRARPARSRRRRSGRRSRASGRTRPATRG